MTGFDGLHMEFTALLGFEKKMVRVYCNCKSSALNVVDVCNINLQVYKLYTFGNSKFVNPKKKDLVRLYSKNAEKPEEYRIVSYNKFSLCLKWSVTATPGHLTSS